MLYNKGNVRKYLSLDITEKSVHALISSRFDYGTSMLYGVSDYPLDRLQKVQNAFTTQTKRREHITPVRAACEDVHSS